MKPDYDTTVARMAGNIASGDLQSAREALRATSGAALATATRICSWTDAAIHGY